MSEVKVYYALEIREHAPEFMGSEAVILKSDYDAKVRELEAKLQSKHEEYIHAQTVYKKSRDECVTLKAQNEKMREALKYYADTESYDRARTLNPKYDFFCELPESDLDYVKDNRSVYAGKLARQVLKELGHE